MATVDIAVKAKDMATKVMKDVEGGSGQMSKSLQDHAKKAALVIAGIGVALEATARKQAELTEKTRNLAASTGIADGKMRELILSTSNVTFTLEDVQDTMISAREQGLKSASALKKYAEYWDMVADATGGSAPELARAGVALNALGIEAGKEAKATEALGFVTRETTSTIDQFFSFVGRMGVYLRAMGMDINDTAAVLGVLERELGMSGIVARREFAKAVQESDGDMAKMLKTLGVSTQAFEEYKGKVAESGTVLEEQAAVNEKTFTNMQKLQHWAKETMYRYGDLITMMGNLAPLMIAAPFLIKGLSIAWHGLVFVLGKAKAAFAFVKSLPMMFSLVKEQGLKATLQAGKLWPALAKVAGSIKNVGSKIATCGAEGFQSVIGSLGSLSLATAAQIAGVAGSIGLLAASIYGAVKSYQAWRKALGEEKDALANEKAMLKRMYEKQGRQAVLDYFEKHKGSMTGQTQIVIGSYINALIKGEEPTKMASGGITRGPTLALIGEGREREVVSPLSKLPGLMSGFMASMPQKVDHSGTIRVEGFNSRGELEAVVNIVMERLRREVRGAAV